MPFTLDDLQTFHLYQAKLKTEAKKVGSAGHFVLFKDCTLGDGSKKDLLIVGANANQTRSVEQALKQSGAKLKASGSCVYADGGLSLTAETGSVTESNVHGLGVDVHVTGPGSTGQQGEETRQQDQSGGDVGTGGFQRATPGGTQPTGNVKLGGQEREAIAAFVKQRQDLLEYARTYLQNMEYFRDRAQAAVVQANGLISRADGGERSEPLVRGIQSSLRSVQELRQATHDAHEEQGTHIAKERQVNPAKFGLTGEVGVKLGARTQPLFQQVTDVTFQASGVVRQTLGDLDEAARGLELSLPVVQTGRADLGNLLRYLDGVLEAMGRSQDLLDKSYNVGNTLGNLSGVLNSNGPNEQLDRALRQTQQLMQSKVVGVAEGVKQIQTLCKAALTRIKQAPPGDPAAAERFEKVKAALSDATAKKREFDQKHKEWPDLERQVMERLGRTT